MLWCEMFTHHAKLVCSIISNKHTTKHNQGIPNGAHHVLMCPHDDNMGWAPSPFGRASGEVTVDYPSFSSPEVGLQRWAHAHTHTEGSLWQCWPITWAATQVSGRGGCPLSAQRSKQEPFLRLLFMLHSTWHHNVITCGGQDITEPPEGHLTSQHCLNSYN